VSTLINRKLSKTKQYSYSLLLILAVSSGCFVFSEFTGYHTAALLLLVTVSLIAMFFDIYPVMMAAVLSALIWNYFFIPPRFTLHIGKSEDILMFLMYFIIALLNAVLTIKIRQIEKKEQIKEEKENVLKLYNTLLNSLSHELRTPISAIIGASDNLLNNKEKLSEKNKSDLVSEISMASLRLNRHVENLLNMSRLESGTLKIMNDWCDIHELVYEVLKRVNETEVTQKFDVQIPEYLPYFFIDHGLMEQVLINLVHNAVNYSPADSTITICASCIIDKLVLSVEDEGNGFPEDKIDKVFDRFYRLNNSKTGGTGLGLSIVKGFVESHNGTISLTNKREGGARFTITIPAKTSHINSLNNE
jgi:two-component system, OmpR family, sensor histidine kinase KdpD